jgi:hypothetical protein
MAKDKKEAKKEESFDLPAIDERAVLVYLGTGQFAATKKDTPATQKLESDYKMVSGSGKVTKVLLPFSDELDRIRKIIAQFREYHYMKTTAFGRDGWSLLPSKSLSDYKKKFIEAKQDFDDAVDKFIAVYERQREAAKAKDSGLGKMFRETDYPPKDTVESKFRFTADVRRIQESENPLLGVSDDLRQAIVNDAQDRIQAGLEAGIEKLLIRVKDVLENIASIEGKKRISDSLISNVLEIADEIPALNVTNNPNLDRIAKEMVHAFQNVSPDEFRGKDKAAKKARKQVAEKAEDILDKVGGII